jgi:hypothetical protein
MPVGPLLEELGHPQPRFHYAFTMTPPPCSKAAPTQRVGVALGAEVAKSECALHRVVEGFDEADFYATGPAWDPRGHVDSWSRGREQGGSETGGSGGGRAVDGAGSCFYFSLRE